MGLCSCSKPLMKIDLTTVKINKKCGFTVDGTAADDKTLIAAVGTGAGVLAAGEKVDDRLSDGAALDVRQAERSK